MEKEDDILRAIRANKIAEFDNDRKGKPTREDVGELLKEKEGQVFYFKITYNHSSRKMEKEDYDAIEGHLYDEYYLYKLKSSIDSKGNTKGQTLSRSTYMGFIDHEQVIGIAFVQAIVKMLKKSVFELQVNEERDLPIESVHVLASMAIGYQEENEEEGEEDGEEEEEGDDGKGKGKK